MFFIFSGFSEIFSDFSSDVLFFSRILSIWGFLRVFSLFFVEFSPFLSIFSFFSKYFNVYFEVQINDLKSYFFSFACVFFNHFKIEFFITFLTFHPKSALYRFFFPNKIKNMIKVYFSLNLEKAHY